MVSTPGRWLATPANLEISSTTIDVWRCPLNLAADKVDALFKSLSTREQQRAEGFRFADKRHQFVITRARLRQCLALATGTDPGEIKIDTDASGKPFLADQAHSAGIQFNVSHTDSLALIALTRGPAIGIDIESLNRSVQHSRLAKNYFSTREQEAIASLPEQQTPAAFFACWTRKEAVLKALGTGIAHGLDSFDVAVEPGIAHCETELQSEDGSSNRWCVRTLDCGAEYMAALAYQQQAVEIRLWDTSSDWI